MRSRNGAVGTIRLWPNLILFDRGLDLVTPALPARERGIAAPIGEPKRVRQRPNDRELTKTWEDRCREVRTRVLNVIDQGRARVPRRILLSECSRRHSRYKQQ